jgi:hypothetical protein
LSRIIPFGSVVGACVGLPSALSIPNSVIKQYLYRDLHKNDIVRDLVCRDNNIIVMEVRHVPRTSGSIKIDVALVLSDPF